jgi:hypothetical protein
MPRIHPHAEATYRVVARDDGTFQVEVAIPDSYPTTVSPFATQEDAEAWVVRHRDRVQTQSSAGGWFRKSGGRNRESTG